MSWVYCWRWANIKLKQFSGWVREKVSNEKCKCKWKEPVAKDYAEMSDATAAVLLYAVYIFN